MTWCYKETANPIDGWLSMDEIQRKRTEIPRAMWEAEYDLQEPSFQGRAIDPELLELAFDARHSTNEDRWVLAPEDRLAEYRHKKATYVTSVDWAKERDRTFVTTFDASSDPWWVVEVQFFNKMPWPATVHRAENQYRKYGGYFIHDATGLGQVISDYIDPQLKRRAKFIDFVMSSGRGRMDFFNDYIAAIEAGHIMWPRMDLAYREHKYCQAAGTLVATSDGDVPIEDMVPGAWVMTRQGFKRVVRVVCNGARPVIEVVTTGGTLRCTPDHLIATPDGWMEAGSLTVGQAVTLAGSVVADAAGTASTLVAEQQISALQGMPVDAVGFSGIDGTPSVAPHEVFLVGDQFQAARVDTVPMGADVIRLQSLGNVAVPDAPGHPVSQTLPHDVAPAVAVAVDVPLPEQVFSSSGCSFVDVTAVKDNTLGHVLQCNPCDCVVQVYDLTVEGAQEYIANGVVVHNCTNDDLFSSGSKNHPPDSVVSGCLAWFCRRFLRRGVVLPQEWTKELSGWDLSSVNETVW
jgi:hypothetical protein